MIYYLKTKMYSRYKMYLKGMTVFINVTGVILPDVIKINTLNCKIKFDQMLHFSISVYMCPHLC